MSPGRRRRARLARFDWNKFGAALFVVLTGTANFIHSNTIEKKATGIGETAQGAAAVEVSMLDEQDSLRNQMAALRYRLEAVERVARRRHGLTTIVDTVRVLAPFGPKQESHGFLWHLEHPWGR